MFLKDQGVDTAALDAQADAPCAHGVTAIHAAVDGQAAAAHAGALTRFRGVPAAKASMLSRVISRMRCTASVVS